MLNRYLSRTITTIPSLPFNPSSHLTTKLLYSSINKLTLRNLTSPNFSNIEGPTIKDKVFVAMSGGVDSTVSAHLMKIKGLQVEGIYMRNWDPKEEIDTKEAATLTPCEADWRKVQEVCQQLSIPCRRVDFVKEYWSSVFGPTLEGYQLGQTPNPDLLCNREIKFNSLISHLNNISPLTEGRFWLVTGHYANLSRNSETGKLQLIRGTDPIKDQTYYLSSLSHHQFENVLFPLGKYSKSEVKEIARNIGLNKIAEQPESMGICFVGKRHKFSQFLGNYISDNPGEIVTETGKVIGHHQGLWSHTLGQRVRLSYDSSRWYVIKKNEICNQLVVVNNRDHPLLNATKAYLDSFHWISGEPPQNNLNGLTYLAKVRSTQTPVKVKVSFHKTSTTNRTIEILFENPVWALAPGQYIVLYTLDQICLGSGILPSDYAEAIKSP